MARKSHGIELEFALFWGVRVTSLRRSTIGNRTHKASWVRIPPPSLRRTCKPLKKEFGIGHVWPGICIGRVGLTKGIGTSGLTKGNGHVLPYVCSSPGRVYLIVEVTGSERIQQGFKIRLS